MKQFFPSYLLLLVASLTIFACKDSISYVIPDTYNFENVSYSGQTARLNMLGEMKAYMASSRQQGVSLDASRLAAMYANDAATAQWQGSYDSGKQLRSKTLDAVQADFDALLTELALASQSQVAGSDGVSGVIQSSDGSKSYLVGDDGLDHAQVIEKGLMGACLYYQATSVYMGADRMNVDNETVTPGEGTDMEHHWDEAFGYLGVPINFPSNTDGILFWGSYTNSRNELLGSNQKLMDALLAGRAAISNNDLLARDQAIEDARREWELVSVGTALHYLNGGIADFDDMALRSHDLSEAIGFIYALKFNEGKSINNSQIDALLELVAGSCSI